MKPDISRKPLAWLFLAILHGICVMRCIAGSPGPPVTEAGLLATLQQLKTARDETMPGDNVPRRIRLTGAVYALARFHNDNKSYEKADPYYVETLALISEDKSDGRPGNLRYYSHAMATAFMNRGDLGTAKAHLDRALKICREDPKQKEVLSSVLITLAEWQRQMKQFKEAETTLMESIGLSEPFATTEQVALAKIYLETSQLAKTDKIIIELEKSNFMSYAASVVMSLRAQWFRASGKSAEAEELEAKARTEEAKEIENLKNSQ